MIKCRAKIEKVLFPKNGIEDGNFAIVKIGILKLIEGDVPVTDKYGNVVIKGVFPAIRENEEFFIVFNQPVSNEYGVSYSLISLNLEIDENNKKEVDAYLDFICPKNIAKQLKDREDGYSILKEKNRKELLKIKGIGEATLERIFKRMDLFEDTSYAMTKLLPLGLTKNQIVKICNSVGSTKTAVGICERNPYYLVNKVDGIGFKTADEIALKMGFGLQDPRRVKCAIESMLMIEGERGKSYLTIDQVVSFVFNMINIYEPNLVLSILCSMQQEGMIIVSADGKSICHKKYFMLEKRIAEEIKRINSYQTNIEIPPNWMDIIRKKEEKQGWNYDPQQLEGIKSMLFNNLTVVAGMAGTGKSTITDALCDILEDYDISMCCLSAKASQRLREVTGRDCYTIHKLLGLGGAFQINELMCDVLIVDEASMINGSVFLELLKVCRRTKIIILGDEGQLTAIGSCSVFSDLLESNKVNIVRLNKIHRQAKKSAIITESYNIRKQIPICKRNFEGKVWMGELKDLELNVTQEEATLSEVISAFKEEMERVNNILEVQIVTPTKTRGKCSTSSINSIIQSLYNKCEGKFVIGYNKCTIFVGDKVINTKNNYKAINSDGYDCLIWNGSIGIVTKILGEAVYVNFQGIGEVLIESSWFKYLNLAYAITIHSSQGSQWTSVICTASIEAYVLLNVEILYTGISRAMKRCRLVISTNALWKAMETVEQKTKQTLLKTFL